MGFKKKGEEKKIFGLRKKSFVLVSFLILALLLFLIWQSFFSYSACEEDSCFRENLLSCSKASYIGGENNLFEYKIKGERDGLCEVDLTLLKGNFNLEDSKALEGLSMTCRNPKGLFVFPESNLKNCHGELKEEIQNLIIERLHFYISENIGRINLEVLDVPRG